MSILARPPQPSAGPYSRWAHARCYVARKLNLNIASAHVATFGERVVDVFYITDLLGAKIESAPRQAAIKRALIQLFAVPAELPGKPAAG